MKRKSNNLSKLERNRKSLFTDDLKHCIVSDCHSDYKVTLHEIYPGRNRQNSMRYNLCIPLCLLHHHNIKNRDFVMDKAWKIKGQLKWEETRSRKEFIDIFKRSYL